MKGLSDVIAVILLLLITIAIIGFAFVFFTKLSSTATNATQQQLDTELSKQGKLKYCGMQTGIGLTTGSRKPVISLGSG